MNNAAEINPDGNGDEARFVIKRLRISSFNSFHVTLTSYRNGLRNRNLSQ